MKYNVKHYLWETDPKEAKTRFIKELKQIQRMSIDDDRLLDYNMCDDQGYMWRVIRIEELLGELNE